MKDYGGIGITEVWDHPDLIIAREQGDPERFARVAAQLRRPDGTLDRSGYVQLLRREDHNLMPLSGMIARIDLVTGHLSNSGLHWYLAPFESDSTPTRAWTGDFGKTSGGNCTEFVGYDETTRQECLFGAASGTDAMVTAANSPQAILTVSAGVTGKTLYGLCLTNNSAKQYGSGSAILFGTLRYELPIAVLALQLVPIQYQIYQL